MNLTLTAQEQAIVKMALQDWARTHDGLPIQARIIALDLAEQIANAA